MRSITLFEIYRGKLRVPGFGHVITRVPRFCHLIGVLIFIPYDLCDLYTFLRDGLKGMQGLYKYTNHSP